MRVPGLNVQAPWAELIISGKKRVETRFYPLPEKYVGREIAIIETPGRTGQFRKRVIGIVVFGPSFKYKSPKHFRTDFKKHLVPKDSEFSWRENAARPKWGWPVISATRHYQELNKSFVGGIVYAKEVTLKKRRK